MEKKYIEIKKFDVVFVNMESTIGSEQRGYRPAIIVQNDKGNYYSPNTIVMFCTTKKMEKPMPQHMVLKKGHFGFNKDTVLLGETITTISKERIVKKIGHINNIHVQNQILDIFLSNFSGKRYNNNTLSLVS